MSVTCFYLFFRQVYSALHVDFKQKCKTVLDLYTFTVICLVATSRVERICEYGFYNYG